MTPIEKIGYIIAGVSAVLLFSACMVALFNIIDKEYDD